ncbi:MAG: alpha/beta fold hydrolase [Anaerolineae bacterium]|nr:alpha/beta fold hydrolase [Anaerolineae bacterium]
MTRKCTYPSLDGIRLCAVLHEPDGSAVGSVVLAHGITVDKDESGREQCGLGAFEQLAGALVQSGFNVLRFDYRGHGESELDSTQMTVAGELADLIASVKYAQDKWSLPVGIVGASFGGVTSVMYAAHFDLPCLVLWNPVLDVQQTFLDPVKPALQAIFNAETYALLETQGYLSFLGFRLGVALIEELKWIKPLELLDRIQCPVLTLHGDQDHYVPYEVSAKYAGFNAVSEFVTVSGALHGFQTPDDRAIVIPRTVDWFQRHLLA